MWLRWWRERGERGEGGAVEGLSKHVLTAVGREGAGEVLAGCLGYGS